MLKIDNTGIYVQFHSGILNFFFFLINSKNEFIQTIL